MKFEFDDIAKDLNTVDGITINLLIKNGFPTEANAEAGFLDASGNKLSTFFNGEFLESGIVENNKVVEPNEFVTEITFTNEDILLLDDTQFIYFDFLIKTTDEGKVWVDFYSNYSIEVTIGVKATMAIKLDTLIQQFGK